MFVILCVAFLIYTTTVDWTLVEEDYYPTGLKHEQILIKKRNYNALQEPLSVNLSAAGIIIRFPSCFKGEQLGGHIRVYRPSDKTLDHLLPVKVDTALMQSIPLSLFRHGDYLIKVDWHAAGKAYYVEKELFVP